MKLYITSKKQREDECHLVDAVSYNILHHGSGDESFGSAIRFASEQFFCG